MKVISIGSISWSTGYATYAMPGYKAKDKNVEFDKT